MPNYTHLDLNDVEDQAPNFAPGVRVPFGHTHREQEELYVVVRGSARVKVGDEVLELSEMDALRVPPGVMRAFEGGPEGVEYVVFGAPQVADPAEAEMQPGWWKD